MKPKITLRKALNDSELLGSVLGGDSWANWRAMLLAANGEPLEPAELSAFRAIHRTDGAAQDSC
jgi:hypothetical protein